MHPLSLPNTSVVVVLGEALLEYHAPPPPPCHRAAAGWSLPQPLLLPLLDQGVGDVTGLYVCWTRRCRPFGTRISGDLDHDEYESTNPILLNASARDLQGYVDALPYPSLLDDSMD